MFFWKIRKGITITNPFRNKIRWVGRKPNKIWVDKIGEPNWIKKNTTGVDTSNFAKSGDLASLKSDVDTLNIGKLKTTPVNLSKLIDVV